MKRISIALVFATVFAAVLSVAGQKPAARFVQDEVLVKFREGVAATQAERLNSRLGAAKLEDLGDLRWQRVRVPAGSTVEKTIEKYRGLAEVEDVQPNYYYSLLLTPNDPLFNPPNSMYGLTKISAPAAWDLTTGSSTVVVADIDTGIRYTHEDLAANVWQNPGEIAGNGIDDDGNGFIDDYYGYDFRYNDPDPWDEHGHGTHTAGTIGAAGNNLLGVVGVNWNVKVMSIKIYSAAATDSTSAMLVNAYNYVRLMKNRGVNIRATNNSYGDCPEACSYDQATKDALDAMGEAGILNVFSAVNSNINNDTSPSYPVSYNSPTIIGVAASDSNDAKAGFSSYGVNNVDLAAPGVSIRSTTFQNNSTYGTMSGTSMATPHVTGAAALLSAFNPSLSPASLKATLMNSVDHLANWSTLVRSGGRLNVANALQNQTVCSFDLASNSLRAQTKGGYYSVNVTAAQNCDYSAKSNANWIHVSGPGVFSGSGMVTFRVSLNSRISRSGTITIGGSTFTVTQSRQK
jgi:subtilisin family serine protease